MGSIMTSAFNKIVGLGDAATAAYRSGAERIVSSGVAKAAKLKGSPAWDASKRIASDIYARSGGGSRASMGIVAGSAAAGAGVGAWQGGPNHRFRGAITGGIVGAGAGAGGLLGMGTYKSAMRGEVGGAFRGARSAMKGAVSKARDSNEVSSMAKEYMRFD